MPRPVRSRAPALPPLVAALLFALLFAGCRRAAPRLDPGGGDASDGGDSVARARVAALVADAVAAERAGRGEPARGLRLAAAQLAAGAGLSDEAARQHLALVFANLYRTRDLVEARRQLQAAVAAGGDATVQAQILYYQGLVARAVGDTGEALRALEQATARARALGLGRDAWAAAQQHADLLGEVGRVDEALAIYRALEPARAQQSHCDRAAYDNSFAWVHLFAAEARHPSASLPLARWLLARSLDIYRQRCATATASIANVLCNQALAALLAGQLDVAARALAVIAESDEPLPVHVELWRLDVAARLLGARGQLRAALDAFLGLERLAKQTLAGEARWRALVGQAEVLHRLGRSDEAIDAYVGAEEVLDEILLHMPLGEGRGGLALMRNTSASGLVAQLLARRRLREAVTTARHARARVLRVLDRQTRLVTLPAEQRRRWDREMARFLALRAQLEAVARDQWSHAGATTQPALRQQQALEQQARDALRDATAVLADSSFAGNGFRGDHLDHHDFEPAGGMVTLGYFPLPTGWMGFAVGRGVLIVRRLEIDTAKGAVATGRQLLAPFAAALAKAGTVRVLPYGPLASVDFHALSFRGRPLIATHAVVYGLDMPHLTLSRGDDHGAPAGPSGGLLIADPSGNLPGARAEADQVLRSWSALVPSITVLRGLEATRARSLAALEEVALFHYAGHGRHAGVAGFDSALPLADGGSLSLGDVLTLRRAPPRVVLLGCDTGPATARADVGLGLAQAFVLAGAQQVLAAARPVADPLALALAGFLYQGPDPWLPSALQRAQRALAGQNLGADWAAFRIFVP